ncbi:MAG: hypothetical protein HYZ25_05355 [Chloroflexi bacterium]|nr:hypothetical protein [Chloroflexota bacterium]
MSLSNVETLVNIAQSLTTILAIIIGGIWSYVLFVSRRQKYPRAKIEHQVAFHPVVPGKLILSLDTTVINQSDALLSLASWEIKAKQMLPPTEQLAQFLLLESKEKPPIAPEIIVWDTIAARKEEHKKGLFEIEPGEQHQFHLDFLINADVSTILVESFFNNAAKRGKPVGWSLTTIHDITHSKVLERK